MVRYYRLDASGQPVPLLSKIQYIAWLRSQPKEKQTTDYYIIKQEQIDSMLVRAYFLGYSNAGSKLFQTVVLDAIGLVSFAYHASLTDTEMAYSHLLDKVRAGEALYRR